MGSSETKKKTAWGLEREEGGGGSSLSSSVTAAVAFYF
jgi:hypothetical protein